MLRSVTVQHLDFEAVLQIDPAVPARLAYQKLDMQPEVAILFFCDNVSSPVRAAGGSWIVCHDNRAGVDRIINNLPLDRQ